ncbi:MAG: type I-E CRISPR-associated protein Cas6/Cse3/CasE [Candidatus Hydrogenedentes bacterium]|nr:type I-E CRISPR-associated protein Cas6/Cse3/CasE [Candidatus Hydrogenedentota bacterium]
MSESPELFITAIHVPADSEFSAVASWDYYKIHQLVSKGYTNPRNARILFRFDIEGDAGILFIQSRSEPDWSPLDPSLRSLIVGPRKLDLPLLEPGIRLRFRLLARPSKRVGDKLSQYRGRRRPLITEQEQRDWLDRKAEAHGFSVEQCILSERVWYDSKKGDTLFNGMPKPIVGIQFDGTLAVARPIIFREAVSSGIGSQKAYGFGLLSIAPV